MNAIHISVRWAFIRKFDSGTAFLGKYCWGHASGDDPQIRTFRTRTLAREARDSCCYKKVKIEKVKCIIVVEE